MILSPLPLYIMVFVVTHVFAAPTPPTTALPAETTTIATTALPTETTRIATTALPTTPSPIIPSPTTPSPTTPSPTTPSPIIPSPTTPSPTTPSPTTPSPIIPSPTAALSYSKAVCINAIMEANSQFAKDDVIESIIGEYEYTVTDVFEGYIKDEGNEVILYWKDEEWIIANETIEGNVIASCATHFIHYNASECDPYTIDMEIANPTNAHEIAVTEGSCALNYKTTVAEEVNEEVKSCWEYPSYDDCWLTWMVVAVLCVPILLCCIVYCCWRRQKRDGSHERISTEEGEQNALRGDCSESSNLCDFTTDEEADAFDNTTAVVFDDENAKASTGVQGLQVTEELRAEMLEMERNLTTGLQSTPYCDCDDFTPSEVCCD